MSKTKGPFEAGIRILKGWIHMPEPDMTEIHNAVKVLEAAGKVDQGRAISVLATLLKYYVMGGGINDLLEKALKDGAIKELRALLESLPDKEKP